jgi:Uri superfamily endonuclease
MDSGTYTLLLELEPATVITFGAAGTRHLPAGYYVYTGSAFGPGGLTRVNRHREVCTGTNTTRHWHIDYLLGASESSWDEVWTAPVARECVIAESVPGTPIEGIGASDCGCDSHLTYNPSRNELVDELESRYSRLNQK